MLKIDGNVLKFILDIFLVLLILIQLFKIFRGTKGIYLLNGIILLFLAYAVSASLGLEFLSRLLNFLMLMLIVALPIIFQSELKRALERLGSKNPMIKWFLKTPPIATESIDIVVEAVERLSQSRTGALIVFEREEPLVVVNESGIYIDAVLSKLMIEQIFYPRSPLHDGAVVIKGNRLRAAGCFLPLNNELRLPQELGSRHRAGLSLAAQTDALVVVVSEETGRISLAQNSELETNLSAEQLKFRLQELIQSTLEKAAPVKVEIRPEVG